VVNRCKGKVQWNGAQTTNVGRVKREDDRGVAPGGGEGDGLALAARISMP
jgi:hypothetical protein